LGAQTLVHAYARDPGSVTIRTDTSRDRDVPLEHVELLLRRVVRFIECFIFLIIG
jgi:hypothetical protein